MEYPRLISFFILACLFSSFTCCTNNSTKKEEIYGGFTGEGKYNPERFASLPDSIPFNLSMQPQIDTLEGERVLNLELLLYNHTQDTVYLTAMSGEEPYYDFIITELDNTRIWSRLQVNTRGLASALIKIGPGDTLKYQHSWNYNDYDHKTVKSGKYLLFGGLEQVQITDSQYLSSNDLDNIGVGPDTLFIK